MPQSIDVTGLSPEAVRLVESLVGMLRAEPDWNPPNQSDAAGWSAELRRWAGGHPVREIEIDDSRESIYTGRGE